MEQSATTGPVRQKDKQNGIQESVVLESEDFSKHERNKKGKNKIGGGQTDENLGHAVFLDNKAVTLTINQAIHGNIPLIMANINADSDAI
ncbi:hypothetical protein ACOSP7_028666 [Xanthoceras sorbifolium]